MSLLTPSIAPDSTLLKAHAGLQPYAVAEGVRRAWPGAWIERLDPAWEAEGLMLAPKYSSASWNRRR
ncbi:MAG: hypothetical protein HY927_10440 [Elusimicrobia bacterium]|nr:hypothetical protein [Elusimicrobiota bacterium]